MSKIALTRAIFIKVILLASNSLSRRGGGGVKNEIFFIALFNDF